LDGEWERESNVLNRIEHDRGLRLALYRNHNRCGEVNVAHCFYLSLISPPEVT
jgi:hypothetical protein